MQNKKYYIQAAKMINIIISRQLKKTHKQLKRFICLIQAAIQAAKTF